MSNLSKLNFLDGKLNIEFDNNVLSNSLFFTLVSAKDISGSIEKEIKRVKNDLDLIESAFVAINNLDDVLFIMRTSSDDRVAMEILCEKYSFSNTQSLFVLDLPLTELNVELFTSRKSLMKNYLEFLNNNLDKNIK